MTIMNTLHWGKSFVQHTPNRTLCGSNALPTGLLASCILSDSPISARSVFQMMNPYTHNWRFLSYSKRQIGSRASFLTTQSRFKQCFLLLMNACYCASNHSRFVLSMTSAWHLTRFWANHRLIYARDMDLSLAKCLWSIPFCTLHAAMSTIERGKVQSSGTSVTRVYVRKTRFASLERSNEVCASSSVALPSIALMRSMLIWLAVAACYTSLTEFKNHSMSACSVLLSQCRLPYTQLR